MSYRPERERGGYCALTLEGGGAQWIARNEREALLQACMDGRHWYDATDLYGDLIHIRLDIVQAVADCSPEGLIAYEQDQDDRKAHEVTDK